MSTVEITYIEDEEVRTRTVYNPEYIDVLMNVGEVAVDGRIFVNVQQVRIMSDNRHPHDGETVHMAETYNRDVDAPRRVFDDKNDAIDWVNETLMDATWVHTWTWEHDERKDRYVARVKLGEGKVAGTINVGVVGDGDG